MPADPAPPPPFLTAAQQEELEIAARAKEPPVKKEMIGDMEIEIHLSERDEVKLDRALAQWAQEIAAQKFKPTPPRHRGKDV